MGWAWEFRVLEFGGRLCGELCLPKRELELLVEDSGNRAPSITPQSKFTATPQTGPSLWHAMPIAARGEA